MGGLSASKKEVTRRIIERERYGEIGMRSKRRARRIRAVLALSLIAALFAASAAQAV